MGSDNGATPPHRVQLGVCRVAAWCVDWAIITAYAALLVPIGLFLSARSVELTAAAWNAISFGCLIVPVTAWLAFWERGHRAASPGKRLLHLRVRTADGRTPGPGRALARNALKVALPWELGHSAAFTLASPTVSTTAAAVGMIFGVLGCGIALLYAGSLFVGSARPPYDRISGTRVDNA